MPKDTWRERWDKLEPVHRVGSHSDDWGGSSDNLCFCEIKDFIQETIDRAVKEREEEIKKMIAGLKIETGDGARDFAVKATLAHIINNLK